MDGGQSLLGRRRDDSEFHVDVMLRPIEIEQKNLILCVVRDVRKQKENEALLRAALEREKELANTDFLTGAANRRQFLDNVTREIDRCNRYQRPFVVGCMDLDNFKQVNDQFGHAVGDQLLCGVAEVCSRRLRKTDCFARMGGDEFAFLLAEADAEGSRRIVEQVRRELLEMMQKNGWPVTVSAGMVSCREHAPSAASLMALADQLMYEVKDAGKNDVRITHYDGAKGAG
jgi:diguanylate cyclase (GGDEF)-like protein